MAKVRFVIDKKAGAKLLRGNQQLQAAQSEAMQNLVGMITAQFFIEFGKEGSFEFIEFTTDRYTAGVRAADAKTVAILKKHPKWLDQFITNI